MIRLSLGGSVLAGEAYVQRQRPVLHPGTLYVALSRARPTMGLGLAGAMRPKTA